MEISPMLLYVHFFKESIRRISNWIFKNSLSNLTISISHNKIHKEIAFWLFFPMNGSYCRMNAQFFPSMAGSFIRAFSIPRKNTLERFLKLLSSSSSILWKLNFHTIESAFTIEAFLRGCFCRFMCRISVWCHRFPYSTGIATSFPLEVWPVPRINASLEMNWKWKKDRLQKHNFQTIRLHVNK